MSASKPVITVNENGGVHIGPGFWKRVFGGGGIIVIVIGVMVNGMDEILDRIIPAIPAPVTVSAPEFEAAAREAVQNAIEPVVAKLEGYIDNDTRSFQHHIMEPMHKGTADNIDAVETELAEVNASVANVQSTVADVQTRQLSIQSTQADLQRGQMTINGALHDIQKSLDTAANERAAEPNGGQL